MILHSAFSIFNSPFSIKSRIFAQIFGIAARRFLVVELKFSVLWTTVLIRVTDKRKY
jgi:uncharacterized membrane protein YcfT